METIVLATTNDEQNDVRNIVMATEAYPNASIIIRKVKNSVTPDLNPEKQIMIIRKYNLVKLKRFFFYF